MWAVYLQSQFEVASFLQQGGSNPIAGLAVGLINLPGCTEVVQGFGPVTVTPLQDAAVQPHLGAVQTHLHQALFEFCKHSCRPEC